MRILVTGRDGQVARALLERGTGQGVDVVLLGRPELDLTASSEAIGVALAGQRPDVIVAAAAYTAVDRAESEPDQAFAVNVRGAEAVARSAHLIGVPLIHLSTDYVFDGEKATPYVESDAAAPRTVYGASKLAGERLVLAAQLDSVVLRTAWVFSPFGGNFVRTMLRLAESRAEVGVVQDQRGNPTGALDIADAVLAIAANLLSNSSPDLRGVFHMASCAEATWSTFAEAIFARSAERGGPTAAVRPISTADYPTPAPRPANSRLDCARLAARHGVRLGDWRDALDTVITRLVTSSQG